jgi:hypothetical protein
MENNNHIHTQINKRWKKLESWIKCTAKYETSHFSMSSSSFLLV